MQSVKATKIELKPYFWRPFDNSIVITLCTNFPGNCMGGWKTGDKSCAEGHIGALCESCDLYGVITGK